MKNYSNLQREAQAELARRELASRRLTDYVLYNFPSYQINWHHRIIIEKLEAVERGECNRLMIFVPPRNGKSELGSIQFPSWYLGRHPKNEIIATSYAADLAVGFGRKVRNLVGTEEYQNIFSGVSLAEDSKSAGQWNTNHGGAYIACGVGGPITGRGADILLIDDPHKNRAEADSEMMRESIKEWYRSTAYTRLAPGGSIILILTRWHEDDLSGWLLDEQAKGGDQWDIVQFPAIATEDEKYRRQGEALWPERYSVADLEKIKNVTGTREWLCLYQQTPTDDINSEFKKNWFKKITRKEAEYKAVERYLTIDTAISQRDSADFTGWVENYVDASNNWYISAKRLKIDSADLIKALFASCERTYWDYIGIEKTVLSDAIMPFLKEEEHRRNKMLPIKELSHQEIKKETRIRGLVPRYERGVIYHIDSECSDLEAEALKFPGGKHDDLIDALAYQLQLAKSLLVNTENQIEQRKNHNINQSDRMR